MLHFSMSVSSGDSDEDGVDRVDGTSANKARRRSASNIGGVVSGRWEVSWQFFNFPANLLFQNETIMTW